MLNFFRPSQNQETSKVVAAMQLWKDQPVLYPSYAAARRALDAQLARPMGYSLRGFSR